MPAVDAGFVRESTAVNSTEWQQFRAPDFDEMESLLRGKVIVDGRNLYNPARLEDDGWRYHSVGRSQH